MESEIFVNQLIKWFRAEGRDLPWRNTKDAYPIWLSEIILQQTRVAQGIPYYHRFISEYPSIEDLAAASESEVLRLWQGLGYYSRARNLHSCAKTVVEQYGGQFPKNYDELLKLKGIGRYTAAAIGSLAFDLPVAVVDGNVFRVLSRVFGITDDIAKTGTLKVFEQKANALLPNKLAAEYNQAIMDFGAMQCTPKNPDCSSCPMNSFCFANKTGKQAALPIKSKKVKVRDRHFNYLVFQHNSSLFLKERTGKDIWKGLYDFALKEFDSEQSIETVLAQLKTPFKLTVNDSSPTIKHVLSHQRIFAKFIRLEVDDLGNFETMAKELGLSLFSIEQVKQLPKPILIQNYLKAEIF